jgi:hypothetical protein
MRYCGIIEFQTYTTNTLKENGHPISFFYLTTLHSIFTDFIIFER